MDPQESEGVADMPCGCAAIQRSFHRLEKGADRNLMQSKNGKSEVLHLGRNNPLNLYVLGDEPSGKQLCS